MTADREDPPHDPSALAASHWRRPGYFVRSIVTLGLAQVGTWVAGAAVTILTPRYLGDVNLGKFSFVSASINLIALVASLGTTTLVTREIAREPGEARRLVLNALVTRLPLSVLAWTAIFAFVMLAVHDELTRRIFLVSSGGILFGALTDVCLAVLQGVHSMGTLAVFSLLSKLGYGLLGVTVLLLGGRAVELAESSVALSAIALIALLVVVHRRVGFRAPVSGRFMWLLVVGGLPFFVWQAALVVYGQVDVVMLSFLTRDAVVGWYSVAYRIVLIPVFLPVIVMTVLFPVLSAATADAEVFARLARRALQFLVLLSVPMAAGTMLLADHIITFAGFPPAFHNSTLPLAILSLHMPLVAVDMLIASILNARDRQRAWAFAGIAAAVLNPILNIPAIEWSSAALGNGAVGSAVVTVLTELFLFVIGLWLLPPRILDRSSLSGSARCLLATAGMSVIVWLMRPLPLPATIAVGFLCYTAFAFLLRAITRNDVRMIWETVVRRGSATEPISTEGSLIG